MSHFAQINDSNKVIDVVVAEQDFINTGALGDPSRWIQTSYNTKGNVHYGPDGRPDGGVALRGNFAVLGGTYDPVHDVFYAPQPFVGWVISESTNWKWTPPNGYPTDNKPYRWNNDTQDWDLIPKPYPSWTLQENLTLAPDGKSTGLSWQAPVAMPEDNKPYTWNEIRGGWDLTPSPYPSWVIEPLPPNRSGIQYYQWQAPVAYPLDGKKYTWDEATVSWVVSA